MLIIDPFNLTFTETTAATQIMHHKVKKGIYSNSVFSNNETVHVAIGNVPMGEAKIRIIQGKDKSYPKQMIVPLYKMVVWDDTTLNPQNIRQSMTEYFVTRDAPEIDVINPVNEPWVSEETPIIGSWVGSKTTYNVNTAFEPATQMANIIWFHCNTLQEWIRSIRFSDKSGSEACLLFPMKVPSEQIRILLLE